MNLQLARAVADAVLYEGYLLYPYRASSGKNQARWQFGVLGPPGAAGAGLGEEASMWTQVLLTDPPAEAASPGPAPSVVVHLRFLQLQHRQVHDIHGDAVEELVVAGTSWTTWDEAMEQELTVTVPLDPATPSVSLPLRVDGAQERQSLADGRGAEAGSVVRSRWPLSVLLTATLTPVPGYTRLELRVDNTHTPAATDRREATRSSLIGAHLVLEAHGARFVSLLEPPREAVEAVSLCSQHRCWPVLTGAAGDTDLVLASPIILYDYPEIAPQSAGALFDATEIDEILTLRVMTMTGQEKAEARATDPRAREIIDRCEAMTMQDLQQLHGVLRDPHPGQGPAAGDVPWWDPEADAAVDPELTSVTVDGVEVRSGSVVRVHPSRRADAQDLFFEGRLARVSAVVGDVDGGSHIALVLLDDPAADLHDWYGRYLYFAPEEVTPLTAEEERELGVSQPPAAELGASRARVAPREESRP